MADVSKLITKKLAQTGYTLVKDMRAIHRDGEMHYVIGTDGNGYTLFQAAVKGKDVSLSPMVWNAKLDDAVDYANDFTIWWTAYGSAEPEGLWGGYSNGRSVEDDRPKSSKNGKAKDTRMNGKPLWTSKDNRWTIYKGDDNTTVGLKGIVATVTVHKDGRHNIVSIDDRGEVKQWCATPDIPIYVMNEVIRILVGMTKGKTPVYSENRRRGNGPLGSRSAASIEEDVRRHVGDERFPHIQAFLADHPGYSLAEVCYDEDNWYFFGEWERKRYGKKASKAAKPGKGASASSSAKLPYDPNVLAGEMTMFMAAADPFEFADQYGDDLESAHRDTLRGISTVDGVLIALQVLDDMGKQPDRDLEKMRKSLIQKLNLMRDSMGFYGSGNRGSRR